MKSNFATLTQFGSVSCIVVGICLTNYPPTKSEGYSFGVICASVRPSIPSVRTFCLCGTISQYLLVRFNYTPRKQPPANFVCRGYTVFTLSVRASVRPSVTLCFLNNSKSHCWIFIKPCKHVHICKTNTLDKKVRARGQFY